MTRCAVLGLLLSALAALFVSSAQARDPALLPPRLQVDTSKQTCTMPERKDSVHEIATFSDYQHRMIAYRDRKEGLCYLERMSSGQGNLQQQLRLLSRRYAKAVPPRLERTLYTAPGRLSKYEVYQVAGLFIAEFCRGLSAALLLPGPPGKVGNELPAVDDELKVIRHPEFLQTQRVVRRSKRQATSSSGLPPGRRYRGQSQSQFVAFRGGSTAGDTGPGGLAEGTSQHDKAVARVSASSGMGQAQSQSSFDDDCEGCTGRIQGLPPDPIERPGYPGEPGIRQPGYGITDTTGRLPGYPGSTYYIPGTPGIYSDSRYPGQIPGRVSGHIPGKLPVQGIPGTGTQPGRVNGGYYIPGQQPGSYIPGQQPSDYRGQTPGGAGLPQGPPGTVPGRINGGYIPGQQPGVYIPGQQPGGYIPGQQPGGYIPGQQPGGYIPGQQPGGYIPGQQPAAYPGQTPEGTGLPQGPPGTTPGRVNGGYIPGQQPGGYIPGQQPGLYPGQIPGDVRVPQGPPGTTSGRVNGGYIPGQQPISYIPGQQPGVYPGQIPGGAGLPQGPPGITPGRVNGGYIPGQQPGGYIPGQQPGGYIPGQQPGSYIPGQQPGSYIPGQQPGVYPGQIPGGAGLPQGPTGITPSRVNGVYIPGQQPGGYIPGQQSAGHPGQIPGGVGIQGYPGSIPGGYIQGQVPGAYPGSVYEPRGSIPGRVDGGYPGTGIQQVGTPSQQQILSSYPGGLTPGGVYPSHSVPGQLPGIPGFGVPGTPTGQTIPGSVSLTPGLPGQIPGGHHLGTDIHGRPLTPGSLYPSGQVQQPGGYPPGSRDGLPPGYPFSTQYPVSPPAIPGIYQPGTGIPGAYPPGHPGTVGSIPDQQRPDVGHPRYTPGQIGWQPDGSYQPGAGQPIGGPGTIYPHGYQIPGQHIPSDLVQGYPSQYPPGYGPPTGIAQYPDVDGRSQVQTSVQQENNETLASSSAQGLHGEGKAQTQVSGSYKGTGSFSAQAQTSDRNRGAQSQVLGGSEGATSAAQAHGGSGQSQAEVKLGSESGLTQASSQTSSAHYGSQSEVQAGEMGGNADAQARGLGNTQSQAQVGFKPYQSIRDDDDQRIPFRGGGSASAQTGRSTGSSQSQVQGSFRFGVSYTGAAQSSSGTNEQIAKDGMTPLEPLKKVTYSRNETTRSESSSRQAVAATVAERTTSNNNQIGGSATTQQSGSSVQGKGQGRLQGTSGGSHFDGRSSHTSNSGLTSETHRSSYSPSRQDSFRSNLNEDSEDSVDSEVTTLPPQLTPIDIMPAGSNLHASSHNNEHRSYISGATGQKGSSRDSSSQGHGGGHSFQTTNIQEQQYTSSSKDSSIQQPTQSQSVILGNVDNYGVRVIQDADGTGLSVGDVIQSGQRLPGTSGYVIPGGFRGRVVSTTGEHATATSDPGGQAQTQTVILTPGSGNISYTEPSSYTANRYHGTGDDDDDDDEDDDYDEHPPPPQNSYHRRTYQTYRASTTPYRNVYRQNGGVRTIATRTDDQASRRVATPDSYVSVTKSVTGKLDNKSNSLDGGKFEHTYYTKSSTCGYFTFSCNIVYGSNGRTKICRPKGQTNPDGTPCCC